MRSKTNVGSILIILITSVLVLQSIAVQATTTAFSEDSLIQRAFAEARIAGLQASTLTNYQTSYTTLGEWVKLNGGELGPDAAKVGLNPERDIFLLSVEGVVVSEDAKNGTTANFIIGIYTDTGEFAYSTIKPAGSSLPIPATSRSD